MHDPDQQQSNLSNHQTKTLSKQIHYNKHISNLSKKTFLILIIIALILIHQITKNNHNNSIKKVEPSIANNNSIISQPQQSNISSQNSIFGTNIKINPYNTDEYTYIQESQISQSKIWKQMLYHNSKITQQLFKIQTKYYITKYNINQYQQLPFCIIIPTYNNKFKKRHIRNIKSIIHQNYHNLTINIIDDASIDGTSQEISQFLLRQYPSHNNYKIIINQQRKYSLRNIRQTAKEYCKSQQIILVVDGDDQLIGTQVLKLFNAVFQKEKVWLAYSNSLNSNGKVGYSRPYHPSIIESNSYRQYEFTVSHLRAFYGALFFKIEEIDLKHNNEYFKSAGDMAYCIPMLEMAHKKIKYIPEIAYYYNMNTGLNVHKDRLEQQRNNNMIIRNKNPYPSLDNIF